VVPCIYRCRMVSDLIRLWIQSTMHRCFSGMFPDCRTSKVMNRYCNTSKDIYYLFFQIRKCNKSIYLQLRFPKGNKYRRKVSEFQVPGYLRSFTCFLRYRSATNGSQRLKCGKRSSLVPKLKCFPRK
jgi:hypothetical protein